MLFPVQTPILVATNLVLIAIVYLLLQPSFTKNEEVAQWRTNTGIICSLLFCIFSFWGTDWFHYQDIFWYLKKYPSATSHMEDVYLYIVHNIAPNYYIFRLIIWGFAILLVQLTIKRLQLKESLFWFIFGILSLPLFAYGRFSLANAIMYYGVIITLKPYERFKTISRIGGLGLVLASFFFHKSAIIGIVLVFFCFIVNKINKNSWFYIILGYFLCVFVISIIINQFLGVQFDDSAEFAQASQSYIGRQSNESHAGIGAIIYQTLEKTPYYMMALMSYKIITDYYLPKSIDFVFRYLLFLIIFSTVFVFDFGAHTAIFYRRLLRFSLIPDAILVTYAHQNKLMPKLTSATFWICFASTAYFLSYNLYLSIVKPPLRI